MVADYLKLNQKSLNLLWFRNWKEYCLRNKDACFEYQAYGEVMVG